MVQSAEFRAQIQLDKFYPPRVDNSQQLYRQRIVEQLLPPEGTPPPTLIIEAQAGQGKTTIAQQFLDRVNVNSLWYQVGPEDADPAFFLQALLACFNTRLPEFPSTATVRILRESDFVLFDHQKRIELLLNDLDSCLKDDLYLVFDDLHSLVSHEASLSLMNWLLETAPPKLHFVLCSREPLPLDSWRSNSRERKLLRIGNRDLALDEEEISDFFNQVLNLDLCRDTSRKIVRTTDGWVMGILHLGLRMEQQPGSAFRPLMDNYWTAERPDLHHYFREEILSPLESHLHRPLLLLSLLEVVPVELALVLTEMASIGTELCNLARRNIFIRHLDADNALFGLHHLFQQFLREKAAAELGPEVIRSIYKQAGDYYRRQEQSTQALRYLLLAEDYAAVEAFLKENGMAFLAANQTVSLAAILGSIPETSRRRLGWSCFFLALSQLDCAPVQALPLLDQALQVFSARHDELGELLCLAHIISIHITTTGHYRQNEERLERAEQLFFRIAADLDTAMTILVARSLAMGHCILLADSDQATRFASLALKLARKEKLINFEAALLMMMGYIQIFAGRTSLSLTCLEQAAPYVHHPEVGSFNSLAIRMMLFNFLFNEGDFANYFEQKNQLIDAVGNSLVSQSIAGPFCYVWEMDIAINRGQFDEALDLSVRALAQHPPLSPHLNSLVLQQQGLALALRQQQDQALLVSAESQQLRDLSGGPFFITLNKLVVGLTRAHCGHREQALQLLDEGIEAARQIPTEYLEACGLLHRARVCLETGAETRAKEDIATGLGLMRRNAYRHLWGWAPADIEKTLSFAVEQRIETAYARTLAAQRLDMALLDDGTVIPRLEIRTLGSFKILYRGRPLLQAEDLTPAQRELFCLLLASPGFKLAQETIQLHFWPDSPPESARIKFDTLVSRLRKTLTLPGNTAHYYLQREKGMLWLAHCRVDAGNFLTEVKRGLRHLRLQENWQAGNAFTTAEALWRGEFAPGVPGENLIRAFRQELSRALAEMTLAWSALLAGSRRLPQAVQLVEKALRNDPLCERLNGQLYWLQGQRSAVQARRVLQRFAARLQSEGYPADEIAELLSGITADSAPESACFA
ncbi:ATP-binding protein [Geothermobacter hydrogeniphilus]|uniref:ATP-binding protein n=1 Tax=Geothermobacter hydrogeniphilus TaxID=1969733 RepID=A0A2K2H5M1_9BACT|nr:BTAD domain-containing putative transcriptional regulator [Geothermobacter hydrogeniphilus]PNU18626.1 ATP-binding protein [Geothermobacter hydrogeniphilus]